MNKLYRTGFFHVYASLEVMGAFRLVSKAAGLYAYMFGLPVSFAISIALENSTDNKLDYTTMWLVVILCLLTLNNILFVFISDEKFDAFLTEFYAENNVDTGSKTMVLAMAFFSFVGPFLFIINH